MRNFLAGFGLGILISVLVYLYVPNVKVQHVDIDRQVQNEIDSSGFMDLDAISRGRYLDSLAQLRTK